MKFIAFYLPQYHRVPENDRWWGEGFTDWFNVKNAKPLFKGHNQPRIPYRYYDLANIEVLIDQAQIAQRYGVYGFCYYHYWFKGKKLLEKPLEQMLKCKQVRIPFCLAWANESWTRAWEGKNREILIRQDYGSEKDWEDHILYLMPFFKDERYFYFEGKPLFLIYHTGDFDQFDEMIRFWNNILNRKGIPDLYIVEMLTIYQKRPTCTTSQGVLEFEPMFTLNTFHHRVKRKIKIFSRFFSKSSYLTFDYDKVYTTIIERKNGYGDKQLFSSVFPDWDNTPRLKNNSTILMNASPQKFYKYLTEMVKKSSNEIIFINAWNEWAEGAYLEPDQKYDYAYLESIKQIMGNNT